MTNFESHRKLYRNFEFTFYAHIAIFSSLPKQLHNSVKVCFCGCMLAITASTHFAVLAVIANYRLRALLYNTITTSLNHYR